MADTPKHSVSVAGIVIDDRYRILVVQRRDNGHWEPPGGVLELDEKPEDGVKREILEETGVAVEVTSLSGVYKNMTLGVVSLVFRCRVTGGQAVRTEESSRVLWIEREEIDTLMSPAYAIRVHDAFTTDVHVRSHDGFKLIDAAA